VERSRLGALLDLSHPTLLHGPGSRGKDRLRANLLRRRRSRRSRRAPRSSRVPSAPSTPSFVAAVHTAAHRLSRSRTPAAGSHRPPTHRGSIRPGPNRLEPSHPHWMGRRQTHRRPTHRRSRHRPSSRRSARRRLKHRRSTRRRARRHRLTHRRPIRRVARHHRSPRRHSRRRRSPTRRRSTQRLALCVEPRRWPACPTAFASHGQWRGRGGDVDDLVAFSSLATADACGGGDGSALGPWSPALPAWAAARRAAPPAACLPPAAGSARSGAASARPRSGPPRRRRPPPSRRWPTGCGCGEGGRRNRRPCSV
jgi:hypothetical protein